MFKQKFNGSLLTSKGKTLYYRTANDGNPVVKVYDEHNQNVLNVCVKEGLTPEIVINHIIKKHFD